MKPLSWEELKTKTNFNLDRVNGNTNSHSRLRLFGQNESDVKVTLYRDHHAWCPYCQKVWLWLEEKQIPYRIEKVTMFCYGEKERWYKRIVSSGMLPALELDGRLLTESNDILIALENAFGVLGYSMRDSKVVSLKKLERQLFRAWCSWLCSGARSSRQEESNRKQFLEVIQKVETALSETSGAYFLEQFSIVDVLFTPFLERMNASLFYYKGYSLRDENPYLKQWFIGMENRSTYRGTQSDFHTHVHDLPPQMGGCYENDEPQTKINQTQVDCGPWMGLPDVGYPEPETSREEALDRVLKYRENIIRVNPMAAQPFAEALRCALTHLITGELCQPPSQSASGLRYLRDRINVPRDMSIYAAKRLRESLEKTAALVGENQGTPIPVQHRRDQDPTNFTRFPPYEGGLGGILS